MATKAAAKKQTAPRKAAAPKRQVTDSHKEAMANGRQESAAIRKYLTVLKIEQAPKRRGRRRTPEVIQQRVHAIDEQLKTLDDPLKELTLRQERLHLISDLQDTAESTEKSEDYEDAFVKAAPGYSMRKGIAYDTWRDVGVPAIVLRKAGLKR